MEQPKDFRAVEESIKSFRQGQGDPKGLDSLTRLISMSMIFLAVLAAFASQRSGAFSSMEMKQLNEATFNQAAASDQWSYYQAKNLKQKMVQGELDVLGPAASKGKLDELAGEEKRFGTDQAAIMKSATAFEAKRDAARASAERAAVRSQRMSMASTLFQAAIALGGVSVMVKKRWLWAISLVLGAVVLLAG